LSASRAKSKGLRSLIVMALQFIVCQPSPVYPGGLVFPSPN